MTKALTHCPKSLDTVCIPLNSAFLPASTNTSQIRFALTEIAPDISNIHVADFNAATRR